MLIEPQQWADAVEMLLTVCPDQTMRLDNEGYEALAMTGLDRTRADAAITFLRWRGCVVAKWEDGVRVVRLAADDEQIDRPAEPTVEPRPEKVRRMVTEKQANYLRSLGYNGSTPIDQMTLKQAKAMIGKLVRRKERTHAGAR